MRRVCCAAVLVAACGRTLLLEPGPLPPDAGTLADAGASDAGPPDAAIPDAGSPDAGPPDSGGRFTCPTLAWRQLQADTFFSGAIDPDGTAWLLRETRDAGPLGSRIIAFDLDGGTRFDVSEFPVAPLSAFPRDSDAVAHPAGGPVIAWSGKDAYAFAPHDGGLLWHHSTDGFRDTGIASYALFTRVVAGPSGPVVLVIDSNAFNLYVAVEPRTGRALWSRRYANPAWAIAGAAGQTVFSSTGPPRVVESIAPDGGLVWSDQPAERTFAVALAESTSLHFEQGPSSVVIQPYLRHGDGSRRDLQVDAGVSGLRAAFDDTGGFLTVADEAQGWRLVHFDASGAIEWARPLTTRDGGSLQSHEIFLLDDRSVMLYLSEWHVDRYDELRHYAAGGELLEVCPLPDAGTRYPTAGIGLAPGRLVLMRRLGELEAFDVGASPAARGWVSGPGDFTRSNSAR